MRLSGFLGRGRAVAASVAAGCGDCGDPVEGGHDLDGPGPGFGQAESSAVATVMELCGDVKHPVTLGFRLGVGIGPTSAASRGREHDGRTTTDVLRPRMSALDINNDRCQ